MDGGLVGGCAVDDGERSQPATLRIPMQKNARDRGFVRIITAALLHRRPTSRLFCLRARDADGHAGQAILDASLTQDRPPAVEEYLHGPPHRNPSADRQALVGDRRDTT